MSSADDRICCICGGLYEGHGNNPEPLMRHPHRCCDDCNLADVIPVRMAAYFGIPVKVVSAEMDE